MNSTNLLISTTNLLPFHSYYFSATITSSQAAIQKRHKQHASMVQENRQYHPLVPIISCGPQPSRIGLSSIVISPPITSAPHTFSIAIPLEPPTIVSPLVSVPTDRSIAATIISPSILIFVSPRSIATPPRTLKIPGLRRPNGPLGEYARNLRTPACTRYMGVRHDLVKSLQRRAILAVPNELSSLSIELPIARHRQKSVHHRCLRQFLEVTLHQARSNSFHRVQPHRRLRSRQIASFADDLPSAE